MTTGSINYPPDYKSENKEDAFLPESVAKVICARLDSEEAAIQRARLEREVISAAKAEMAAETRREEDRGNQAFDRLIAATRARRAAVNALIEFEAKQK